LYTVINDDNDDSVRAFFSKNGGEWQKLRDVDGAISVAFGVAKVPETWIIDPNALPESSQQACSMNNSIS
jgi:hypothetical protein